VIAYANAAFVEASNASGLLLFRRPGSAKAKIAALEAAIDDFWGDSTEEEMQPIFDAMRAKSKPSEKGL